MQCPKCEVLIPKEQITFEKTETEKSDFFKCPNCGATIKCKPFNWLKALLIFIVLGYIIPYLFQFVALIILLLNYKD